MRSPVDRRSGRISAASLFVGLALLAAASLIYAVSVGSVDISLVQLWHVLMGGGDNLHRSLILELRLPRALAAFATGAMLAVAGALMQVLLRNPLADPYILGVSGGAAAGALGAMLAGLGASWVSGSAFCGAMISIVLVFGLARGAGGWTPTRLLLTGVVIAAGWGAVVSLLLAVSPEGNLRGMLFWLMGDLSNAQGSSLQLAMLAAVLLAGMPMARSLNLLARGELEAGALGVSVTPLRLLVYVLASVLTATAVMLAGSIGFVGLVVPHMLRLAARSDHRMLLPASALLGGALLAVADTLARTLLAPNQLPVGVLTALIGVPLFLYLLRRSG